MAEETKQQEAEQPEKTYSAAEYTALQELGRSEDGCWMLTLYGRWHGWVSMDHLEKITQ